MVYFFILAMLITTTTMPQKTYIIVHGTWDSQGKWYVPGGDFFDALELNAKKQNASVIPFCWSGANSPDGRDRAAQSLAKLIEAFEQSQEITVIGHSHGGTVGLLASHLLKKNKINILYTLGTPINRFLYPNMAMINYCYNLFSFEDLVQPVLGMFAREHEPHERIGNIRVVIEGKEPDHGQLHSKVIGKWIPDLHSYIINQLDNKKKLSEPGIIYFDSTKTPVYSIDTRRKDLLERDHQLSLLILNSFRKSFEIGSKIPLIKR